MGLLDKILGRGGAGDEAPGPFDCERVKAAIIRSISAASLDST